MRNLKPMSYLLLALIGVPTPSFAASAVESPPVSAAVVVESPPRRLSDYDREVARQDWYRLSVPFRQAACDVRGPHGGTVKGYRKATRYVIRQTRTMGPGRSLHNRQYRRAIADVLRDC